MKDVNVMLVVVTSLLSSAFAVGAFYSTTLYRVKRIEEKQQQDNDMRERLMAIETKLEIIIKNNNL